MYKIPPGGGGRGSIASSRPIVFVMLFRLFIAALWSPAGKGLTSWLSFVMFNCVFVIFTCVILGQMWYLFVSIPDLCQLSYYVFLIEKQKCFAYNKR